MDTSADGTTFAAVAGAATEIRSADFTLIATRATRELQQVPGSTVVSRIVRHPTRAHVYQPFLTVAPRPNPPIRLQRRASAAASTSSTPPAGFASHLFARTCPLRSVDCRRQAARQREAQQSSFAAAGFCRAPPLRSAARAPLSCSGMQHFESDNARSAARAATTRAHESQWLNPLSRSRPSRPTELAIPTVSRLSGRRDFLLAVFWGIWATPQVEPNPNKSRQNEDGAFLSQSW
jgi:hypothetical protein